MEFVVHENNKVLLEVVDDNVVEDPTDHEEIGLQEFDFNVFNGDEEGVVREGSMEFPYLLILINICPGDWMTRLNRMNQKVDEDNEKTLNKGNVRYRKGCRFSSNEFWNNICCLVSAPNFGLERFRLW